MNLVLVVTITTVEHFWQSCLLQKLVKLISKGAMVTVLSTLVSAFALPATLVTASDLIDSKRAVAVVRSDKASELLAEVLTKGLQGNRCKWSRSQSFYFILFLCNYYSLVCYTLAPPLMRRPVTLVGFPLGAPVIFKCLKCLAETGDNGMIAICLYISLGWVDCLLQLLLFYFCSWICWNGCSSWTTNFN